MSSEVTGFCRVSVDAHCGPLGTQRHAQMSATLPIVDLSRSVDEVASTIRDACVNHGFFYLTSHGVPAEVVSSMFAASKDFFNLSDTQKRTVLQDANNRGWTPLGA